MAAGNTRVNINHGLPEKEDKQRAWSCKIIKNGNLRFVEKKHFGKCLCYRKLFSAIGSHWAGKEDSSA